MAIELLCRKIGMTRLYTDEGESIPVTVLEAGPNTVVQRKTLEKDGYTALQLGYGERRRKTISKPELGHFEKAGVSPKRYLCESRVDAETLAQYQVGGTLTAEIFTAGQKVDVIGTSKGRGTAGVVKRHNFAIKRRTHGTHEAFRHGGSIGSSAYPAKVIKGMGMFGRMGSERVTIRNLDLVRVDAERNLLMIRGAIPGHINGVVRVRAAVAARG